jgi:NAD-dependent dihydropyrimidine dehydrogenase PreA subunit
MTTKSIYERLSEKIGVVGYPRYIAILENQMKPEEAELAVDLADGKSRAELMKKLNIDEDSLTKRIDYLLDGGFVREIKGGSYAIPQMPRFFPRINNTPELKKLWFDFFHSGDYCDIDVSHMTARAKDRPRIRSHKFIPARQALLASPNIKKENILWYEDMEQIFRRAKKRRQGGLMEDGTLGKRENSGCGCRRYWGDCEAVGGCTGWEWESGTWPTDETIQYEQSRRRGPRPNFTEVTVEQALAACDAMEEAGLLHLSPNTAQITSTCNCCECCCEIIHGFKTRANIYELLSPSRFKAVIDLEKCQGCQTCVERCHFDAIEMKSVPGSKKMKAFVIDEHCMGCGLCIFKCPNGAMRLEIVRPPSHIPTITVKELFSGRVM